MSQMKIAATLRDARPHVGLHISRSPSTIHFPATALVHLPDAHLNEFDLLETPRLTQPKNCASRPVGIPSKLIVDIRPQGLSWAGTIVRSPVPSSSRLKVLAIDARPNSRRWTSVAGHISRGGDGPLFAFKSAAAISSWRSRPAAQLRVSEPIPTARAAPVQIKTSRRQIGCDTTWLASASSVEPVASQATLPKRTGERSWSPANYIRLASSTLASGARIRDAGVIAWIWSKEATPVPIFTPILPCNELRIAVACPGDLAMAARPELICAKRMPREPYGARAELQMILSAALPIRILEAALYPFPLPSARTPLGRIAVLYSSAVLAVPAVRLPNSSTLMRPLKAMQAATLFTLGKQPVREAGPHPLSGTVLMKFAPPTPFPSHGQA